MSVGTCPSVEIICNMQPGKYQLAYKLIVWLKLFLITNIACRPFFGSVAFCLSNSLCTSHVRTTSSTYIVDHQSDP